MAQLLSRLFTLTTGMIGLLLLLFITAAITTLSHAKAAPGESRSDWAVTMGSGHTTEIVTPPDTIVLLTTNVDQIQPASSEAISTNGHGERVVSLTDIIRRQSSSERIANVKTPQSGLLILPTVTESPDNRASTAVLDGQQTAVTLTPDKTMAQHLWAATGGVSYLVERVEPTMPNGWSENIRALWIVLGIVSAGWIAFHQVKFRPHRPWLVRLAWLVMAVVASPFGIVLYCLAQQRPVMQLAR